MKKIFKPLDAMLDNLQALEPEMFKLCYPHRIPPPLGFASPRLYAAQLSATVILHNQNKLNRNPGEAAMETLAFALFEYNVPTYFIRPRNLWFRISLTRWRSKSSWLCRRNQI